jgi:hypothetical protein
VSGEAAVARASQAQQSSQVANLADVEKLQALALQELVVTGEAKAERGTVRTLGGRTFTLTKGEWQDAAHVASKRVVHVEPFSTAYFDLLRELPELALILRELDAATVAGERVSIRVAKGGVAKLTATELRRAVTEFRQR